METEFRRVEAILDVLLGEDAGQLRAAGLDIQDQSARTYHYKNAHLFWSHTFLKEWRVDGETARVTIDLQYSEPFRPGDPPEIQLTWRAELFRQGQVSSISKRGGSLRPLADLQHDGIAAVVMHALAEGAACLPAAH
jgi:hypothetical protein